jgi:hypothetical protein
VESSHRWNGVRGADQIDRAQRFERTSGGADGAVGDMQIARRGLQVFVTQQLLNGDETGPIFQQMRSEGVPQGMGMNRFGDAGPSRRFLQVSKTVLRARGHPGFSPGKSQSAGRFQRQ